MPAGITFCVWVAEWQTGPNVRSWNCVGRNSNISFWDNTWDNYTLASFLLLMEPKSMVASQPQPIWEKWVINLLQIAWIITKAQLTSWRFIQFVKSKRELIIVCERTSLHLSANYLNLKLSSKMQTHSWCCGVLVTCSHCRIIVTLAISQRKQITAQS